MAKKNNWGGLILLGGLGLLGYILWKGGVFSGQGTNGGAGGFFNGSLPLFDSTPPLIPPQEQPKNLQIGLLASKPVIGTKQPYAFIGENKNGLEQKSVVLTTTPAMREPAIVQARGIIAQTSGIDVGKLISSIPTTKTTYTSTPQTTHIPTTYSGTPVNTVAGLKEITKIVYTNRPSATSITRPLPIITSTLPKTTVSIASNLLQHIGVLR